MASQKIKKALKENKNLFWAAFFFSIAVRIAWMLIQYS